MIQILGTQGIGELVVDIDTKKNLWGKPYHEERDFRVSLGG